MTDRFTEEELAGLRRRSAGLAGLARNELVECIDGPARGQRRLEIDTPSGLSATLVVDRSLDLLSLRYRGSNIGWRGASRARHPIPDLESEHGLGLMRSFDGMLVTCGLDHTGLPLSRGAEHLRYPPRERSVHPLHGRLAAAGVTLSGYGIDAGDGQCVWATAEVHQSGVFTEAMTLYRRVEIDLAHPRVRVRDTVVNAGYRPVPHALLYHVNLGFPLLGEAARLEGEGWTLADRLDDASATPSDDHEEIVDVAPTPVHEEGFGVRNTRNGLWCRLGTDPDTLPTTALWRAYQSGVFALGIEPQTGTCEDGEATVLSPGERRHYRLDIDVGQDAVPVSSSG